MFHEKWHIACGEAYLGLVSSIVGIGIFIPVLGIVLGLLTTAGDTVWLFLTGQRLLQLARLGRSEAISSSAHAVR